MEQDGRIDRQLLVLDPDVDVWRGRVVKARPMKVMWSGVNIYMEWTPANEDPREGQRLRTEGMMERTEVQGMPFWSGDEAVKCAEV